jgi:hypothetical protein
MLIEIVIIIILVFLAVVLTVLLRQPGGIDFFISILFILGCTGVLICILILSFTNKKAATDLLIDFLNVLLL